MDKVKLSAIWCGIDFTSDNWNKMSRIPRHNVRIFNGGFKGSNKLKKKRNTSHVNIINLPELFLVRRLC